MSATVTGPYAMRPSLVATSTIGSSQNSPREPVRTTSTSPACASREATASAPSASAAASRGT